MGKHNRTRKIAMIGGALALAIALPLTALAEVADSTPVAETAQTASDSSIGDMPRLPRLAGRGVGDGLGLLGFGFGVSVSCLTEAQRSAYQDALNAYLATEDEQLANLVVAGVLTQAEVDAYKAQRANRQTLSEIDMTDWTEEQLTAFKEALAKPKDERQQALSALTDSLQLTQAQIDALCALAEEHTSVWQQISGQTDAATMDAIDAMQHARLDLSQALQRAGIGGMGIDGAVGGKLRRGIKDAPDLNIGAANDRLKRAADNMPNFDRKRGIGKGF